MECQVECHGARLPAAPEPPLGSRRRLLRAFCHLLHTQYHPTKSAVGGGGLSMWHAAWPVGWYGQRQRWGIGDSVVLRARGRRVSVAESFARAAGSALRVNYTLRNDMA